MGCREGGEERVIEGGWDKIMDGKEKGRMGRERAEKEGR